MYQLPTNNGEIKTRGQYIVEYSDAQIRHAADKER